jgi:hypothetical protein
MMLASWRTTLALGLLIMVALASNTAEGKRRNRRRRRGGHGGRLQNNGTPFGFECKGEDLGRLIRRHSGLTLEKYACITQPKSKFSVTCLVLFEEVGLPLAVDLLCKRSGWRNIFIRDAPLFGSDINFSTATLTIANVNNATAVEGSDIMSALAQSIPSAGTSENFVLLQQEVNADNDEITFTFLVASVIFFDLEAACDLESALLNDAQLIIDELIDVAPDNFDGTATATVLRSGFARPYAFGICPSPDPD